ncbi:thiamine-phosphate kinase [Natronospirillum operosum]|uniref:Thiamine-monophosphate kinase n=1 Tax=Natronospirillum operosum TaxID=2759953 RepID=A0A4Z0WAL8_9GAMM|nr:thiamine-phosphate kinase [Natronospirillum operosum]TGG90374.1 thiamine-phosphate kinase [Natronospirillum operosum]
MARRSDAFNPEGRAPADGEFARIGRWLLPLADDLPGLGDLVPRTLIDNGDDALAVRPAEPLVISMDMAVAGTHFPAAAAVADAAVKALRAALSDLAAMGARPWFYTLGLVLPDGLSDADWQALHDTLRAENRHWQVRCLGGDLTRGPGLVFSVQVHGLSERPLTRCDARAGEDLWVTGTLGGSAGGLAGLQGERPLLPTLQDAFYRPALPLTFMQAANPLLSAAIDISDGLVSDLQHLLSASALSAELLLDEVPVNPDLLHHDTRAEALDRALYGGEDYQVLFTAPPEHSTRLQTLAQHQAQPISRIGRLRANEPDQPRQLTARWQGRPFSLRTSNTGYDHFA